MYFCPSSGNNVDFYFPVVIVLQGTKATDVKLILMTVLITNAKTTQRVLISYKNTLAGATLVTLVSHYNLHTLIF